MLDGTHFRVDSEEAAEKIDTFGTAHPKAAKRARLWAERGSELIDDSNHERAIRYLLALIGSLSDQNAINTQATIAYWARLILVPLWIIAATLLWLAIR